MKWWDKLPRTAQRALIFMANERASSIGSGLFLPPGETWPLDGKAQAFLCWAYLDLYEGILGCAVDLASIPGVTLKHALCGLGCILPAGHDGQHQDSSLTYF
jgi:hypothetical protein